MSRPDAPLRLLELVVSTEHGGGPAHVLALVSGLAREGLEFTVAGPPDGPYVERFRRAGAAVLPLDTRRLRPATLAAALRLIRARGIDVVHSHGKGAGLYGRLAARRAGVASVHTFHGIHPPRAPGAGAAYLALERWLAGMTDTIIHVSASQARLAAGMGLAPDGRTRVIENGIDAAAVARRAREEGLGRPALGLPAEAPVLGTVARFDPVKRLDLLVEALAVVRGRMPAARLLLVGDGPEAPRLARRARDLGVEGAVHRAGVLPDAARALGALDVFVSASAGEGLPLALLEAMAAGLPVVATRVPGNTDAVEDGTTGLLVPPGDAAALGAAAADLLADPERRARLGAAGRARVEARFGLARMLERTLAVYREASGRVRGARPLP